MMSPFEVRGIVPGLDSCTVVLCPDSTISGAWREVREVSLALGCLAGTVDSDPAEVSDQKKILVLWRPPGPLGKPSKQQRSITCQNGRFNA